MQRTLALLLAAALLLLAVPRSQRKDRLRRSPLGKGSNDNSRRRFPPEDSG